MPGRTLYLAKANNEGVCHCECDQALISWPAQMDCPWCGCGWLFTCMKCRKAFTFAKAVRLDSSLEELARLEHKRMGARTAPSDDDIAEMVERMNLLLEPIEDEDDTFVYFDGYLIATFYDDLFRSGKEEPLPIRGMHRDHELAEVPHLRFRDDPSLAESSWLSDPEYWGMPRED
jgi:hypothetical protein